MASFPVPLDAAACRAPTSNGSSMPAVLPTTSRMHFVPERLVIQEEPPRTDEEWDLALELYGKDRDDPLYRSAPSSAVHSRMTSGAGPCSSGTQRDNGEQFRDPRTSKASRIEARRSRSYKHDSSDSPSPAHSRASSIPATPTTPTALLDDPTLQRRRPLIPRRGLTASDDDDDADIDPSNSVRARKRKAFGVGGMITAPPVMCAADMSGRKKDEWDASQERRRLREIYEKDGYLSGPKPAWRTKVRRRKVIRRLGLAGSSEEDTERRTIISNYMEMAQQMFGVENVGFGLLRDDGGYRYSIDPDTPPMLCPHEGFATNHVSLTTHEVCTIIPDVSRDWRTRNHPVLQRKGARFMAGAPLLYTRHDPPVVFGALVLFDSKPREVFTHREQGLLLRLANMLVYQLATFQSEIMAESAANMYESSLAFLRRSVVPRQNWDTLDHEPTPRKSDKPGIASRRQQRRAKRTDGASKGKMDKDKLGTPSDLNRGDSVSPAPSLANDDPSDIDALIPYVVKSGPREQQDAKKRWETNNIDLFADAASTLRGILGADSVAIYNMEDYSLFFRRTDAPDLELDKSVTDPANSSPLFDFMHGKPWPQNLQPIVHHIPSAMGPRDPLLGVSIGPSQSADPHVDNQAQAGLSNGHSTEPKRPFNFDAPDISQTLSDALIAFLTTRRFWWQTHGTSVLERKVLAIVPAETQTLLIHFMFTFDGRLRTATFACWNRPPACFEESSTLSLPFIQVLGGLSGAALSFRKVRSMEQSQISYSNLQAHELRTPLHQILAITQLLRSAMLDLAETPQASSTYVNSVQQIRDLIPILDAIDTSGKTLHGIVDNILSFLDLKAKDYSSPDTLLSPARSMFDTPSGGMRTLVEMLEETVQEAHEENERSRRSALMPLNSIETIIEVHPKELGERYKEDSGGALRRALSKILSNAYKFIEGPGCVEIRVTDPVGAPQGCEGMCRTRRIQIEVTDNGPGMDSKFVRDHLGEPWAKQDAFTTGSGLSVHLAYRIIDLMGGHMEIQSAPGRGCVVRIEIPLSPVAAVGSAGGPDKVTDGTQTIVDSPEALAGTVDPLDADLSIGKGRRTALIGFNVPGKHQSGLPRLGELISRQLTLHGATMVSVPQADLIVANGEVEELEQGKALMQHASATEIVFLTAPGHEPHMEVVHAAKMHARRVRRIAKPVTPSVIRHILAPPPVSIRSPGHVDFRTSPSTLSELGRRVSVASSSDKLLQTPPLVASALGRLPPSGSILLHGDTPARSTGGGSGLATPPLQVLAGGVVEPPKSSVAIADPKGHTPSSSGNWKPKGMCMEEAIANLCLGDYFSSCKKWMLKRSPSRGSETSSISYRDKDSSVGDEDGTPATSYEEHMSAPLAVPDLESGVGADVGIEQQRAEMVLQDDKEEEEVKVKVLVVEDNMINRKIMVKILSTKLPIEIQEAVDGVEAVEAFKEFQGPVIVLLDINMPHKDGFEACKDMRDIEKADPSRPPAQIIAVTALSAEEEKRHGQQVGFDKWAVKPCGKAAITALVQDARKTLLGIKDEIETDPDLRRYTM